MADIITVKDNRVIIETKISETITNDLSIEQIISERDSWQKSIENIQSQLDYAVENFNYFQNLYSTSIAKGIKTQEQLINEK